jgi:gamma-glutamyltranspeptidase/glutathione hydrolase
LLVLAGCSTGGGVSTNIVQGVFANRHSLSGMVAADEPQAVLAGRDVLTGGGSAADAAVAMAFTMTLTLPSQVGLGSAGVCLTYNHGQKKVEAIDFVPLAGGGPDLVPALPRGLFLLHAKDGKLRWDQLLQPAQALAQRGVPASRAFIRQFTPLASTVLADPGARALFLRDDGKPLGEGDLLRNTQLAAVLGRMGSRGVGEFYGGTWGQEFVTAARQAGATFSLDGMRAFTPQERKPLAVEYGHEIAYFPPAPAAALGSMESAAWTALAGSGAYDDASKAERSRVVADALAHAPAPAADQPAGASLVAVDGDGNAVACALTLNGAFGTGHVVPGFGTFLAAAQPDPGAGLGAMIAINPNSEEFRFAAASSGGVAGAKMLVRTALATLRGDVALPTAVAEEAKGDGPDRLQAARCLSGAPDMKTCAVATDPRGFGLAQEMPAR